MRDVTFYPDKKENFCFNSHLVARLNEDRTKFTQDEIERAYQEIIKNIEGEKTIESTNKSEEIKSISYS